MPDKKGTRQDGGDESTQSNSSDRTYCFSLATCLEVVSKLTHNQLNRELMLFGMSQENVDKLEKPEKADLLRVYMHDGTSKTITQTTDKLISLTQMFTRSANDTMMSLQKSAADVQLLLSSAQKLEPPTHPPPTLPEAAEPVPRTEDAPTGGTIPYRSLETNNSLARFDFASLDSELTFDSIFANRKVAYFGDVPYKYSGGHHKAKQFPSDSKLAEILVVVEDICKSNGLNFKEFNSCMITKYESPDAHIPPHSDNEASIAAGSSILTVSIGGTRDVVFRRRPPGEQQTQTLTVKHGDCYVMTRSSQDFFDHSVPKLEPARYDSPRISITLRKLEKVSKPVTSSDGVNTKNVLILSDSKNPSFDCSELKAPIAAFRDNMFYLRDLDKHREAIRHSDVVLISAGINDIKKNRVSPRKLHDHVRNFEVQFPNTQFLFEAVSPVTMAADPFHTLNSAIDQFNELMFKCSLHHENFKLFDNLGFSLAHLSRDGLHFKPNGQRVISDCWKHVILIKFGFRHAPLPIRKNFLTLYEYDSFRARDFNAFMT
ncbi:hypothetical protein ACHWQZ_G008922 [Mnemiopsis leidyi]